ncbi:hypothetical protein EUGRSUZ_E03548 [Eucalyptus grandis]|uniref:Uncharacterized protein n=2 Tax=Eucalyptus grandis TaxID=71139 RepID=A0ACC3L0Z4_EUCGR|nr:hypothetical protein EUGRSUZ_E03548 [Eucalyptus grandis]
MKPSGIRLPLLSPPLLIFLLLTRRTHLSCADVGTAASYGPPYTPTACYGNDSAQFPSSNLFAAAGESIWDNGVSCGRRYLVRCTSAIASGICIRNQTVEVGIVDYAPSSSSRPSSDDATIVLSTTAFDVIAKFTAAF